MTKNRAVFELILAGVFWGFGFVATVWALRVFTPAETLFYRFLIATVVGELAYLLMKGLRFSFFRKDFFRAFPAGLLLGGMLLLQTIGLQYTSATKSGFLTSLYVIFVPLISSWLLKVKSDWRNYFLALLAMLGTYTLMGASIENLNQGDFWTIGCAFFAAFHIIYIGFITNKIQSSFRFNNYQGFWCLLILAPLLATQDSVRINTTDLLPWIGIACLGIASSLIAFFIQVRTQKILSDTTASMLFLLESPFAAFFGYALLNERLTLSQVFGAVLILATSVMQIAWSAAKNPEAEKS